MNLADRRTRPAAAFAVRSVSKFKTKTTTTNDNSNNDNTIIITTNKDPVSGHAAAY